MEDLAAPNVALGSITFGSTSKEIESAQAETRKLLERVGRLEASVTNGAAPAETVLRTELGEIREQLESVDVRIEKAKGALVGLLPDATDLAYLKVAKAYTTEIHNILTKHIAEDHRRKAFDITRAEPFTAWSAIGVSLIGVAISFWKATHP